MESHRLSVDEKLYYARSAVAVLRALKIQDGKMSHKDLAKSIGIIQPDDAWEPWHRQQTASILNVVSAIEEYDIKSIVERLEYDRIINAATGQPGAGAFKDSFIVTG